MLLDYANIHPNVDMRYHASNMILYVKLDDAYLVQSGFRSRIAGHYYASDHTNNPTNNSDVKPSGPILMECNTLRHVVGSTA